MCELKNTIRFTIGNGADKPAICEVANFVKGLDAELDEIEAAYRISEGKSLSVKLTSERSMLHALTANSDEQLFHYANGKKVKVHMSHAQDKISYVRIYDLPPEVPDLEIITVMSKYGRTSCSKQKVRTQSKMRRQVKDCQPVTYASAVAGATNSGQVEAQGEVQEECQETAADTETREMDPCDRALMQFTEYMTSEINKAKEKEEEEEAKLKSPPRKKKNLSLNRR